MRESARRPSPRGPRRKAPRRAPEINMAVVFLDQNQWIRLLGALTRPESAPEIYAIAKKMEAAVWEVRLTLPLTSANIYETCKINDPNRRARLGYVQAVMSGGLVFAGRRARLTAEIGDFVAAEFGLEAAERPPLWFVSDIFFDAFADLYDARLALPADLAEKTCRRIRADPRGELISYFTQQPDEARINAVAKWTAGALALLERSEKRRAACASESKDMRHRLYKALLLIDECDVILDLARDAGAPWRSVSDIGDERARRLMDAIPAFAIEAEMVVRLDAHMCDGEVNDFNDMASFAAALPYADAVIAENLFSNVARQSRLDRRFDTRVETKLEAIGDFL